MRHTRAAARIIGNFRWNVPVPLSINRTAVVLIPQLYAGSYDGLITRGSLDAAGQLPVPAELIERRIYLIRGQKVMRDSDLAELCQVTTKALNQAVRRNVKEVDILNRSQFVTSSQKHGDPRYLPYVFTELGVAMLSSVRTANAQFR